VKKYDKNIFNKELNKIIVNESRCRKMSYFIKVVASRLKQCLNQKKWEP
jgi:hypothetical protein